MCRRYEVKDKIISTKIIKKPCQMIDMQDALINGHGRKKKLFRRRHYVSPKLYNNGAAILTVSRSISPVEKEPFNRRTGQRHRKNLEKRRKGGGQIYRYFRQ